LHATSVRFVTAVPVYAAMAVLNVPLLSVSKLKLPDEGAVQLYQTVFPAGWFESVLL
jgi:hypothetical protein